LPASNPASASRSCFALPSIQPVHTASPSSRSNSPAPSSVRPGIAFWVPLPSSGNAGRCKRLIRARACPLALLNSVVIGRRRVDFGCFLMQPTPATAT
jgi:hypothetical protein